MCIIINETTSMITVTLNGLLSFSSSAPPMATWTRPRSLTVEANHRCSEND